MQTCARRRQSLRRLLLAGDAGEILVVEAALAIKKAEVEQAGMEAAREAAKAVESKAIADAEMAEATLRLTTRVPLS